MPSYIALRLISAVAMALFASLVIFLISNFVPGDPVLAQLGDILASDPVVVAQWAECALYDATGQSIATRRPVLEDIVQFAPATVELATISFVMALALGIPLGIAAAIWRDSWVDAAARVLSLVGVSAPTFWLAFIMLAIFYGWLGWAPGPGRLDPIAFPPEGPSGFFLFDTA
ncbi:MAG: ABC transporter permease, partial [Rhodospirillales bacterium]|nr:ABC transporter permease [Rhodospirillales bacterium]